MVNESRPKIPLTQNQASLLEFIKSYAQVNGFPPSYREIQRHFGYKAVGTVQDHVRALIQKGALQKSYGQTSKKARALIPSGSKSAVGKTVPVFGEIAAGGPRESIQTELGSLVIGEDLASDDCFALRVVGNSMIDIGIFEGDFVIVDKTQKVKSGDIVVALVDGETTVKRYREKSGKIFL
ncbi:MAG: transcriptional repressor LexA, partial [Pseudomonadota bacterium]